MNLFPSLAAYIPGLGLEPTDTPEVRLEKIILVSGALLVISAAAVWGAIFAFYREYVASAISLGYSAWTLAGLLLFHQTQRYRKFMVSQLLLGLLLPFSQFYVLGGFWNSSAVIIWSLISPIGAMIFYPYRRARYWWLAYLVLLILAGILHPRIQHPNQLPAGLINGFLVLNLASVSGIVFIFLSYFIREKDSAFQMLRAEEQKTESLLLNILPREIAAILKDEQRIIAEAFEAATILFADLVGFTGLTTRLDPVEMVTLLNEIFSHFDALVERYEVEKIRTIGDNYMAVAGVPTPTPDHAHRMAALALDMQAFLDGLQPSMDVPVAFRIGINSGPVIGGVIGRKKFVYDVWGDAVNIASRLESQGEPGKIQISQATYALISPEFECRKRGALALRGRGEIETWYLIGRRA